VPPAEELLALPGALTDTGSRARPASSDAHASGRPALAWLERHALYVGVLAALAALSLLTASLHLNQDAWLALVDGRYIVQHGLPHHDPFGILTRGAAWVDQQWLAQLAIYDLYRLGGLALYSIVFVALAVGSLAAAIAVARALGGREPFVTWVLPLAASLYCIGSFQIRTQGFAYPLFVATLWLLVRDARAPSSRRVYLVLPLLVLWGNLHGSASLGAALAELYGLTLLVEDLGPGGRGRRLRWRTVAFLAGPPLCLLLTPYGPSMVHYYESTLFNPAFAKVVSEWQPVGAVTVIAVPFFMLAFATLWVLGRSGRRTHPFEHAALILLAFGAVFAVRNVTWFALGTLMLLPAAIATVASRRPEPQRRASLNLAFLAATGVFLLASLATVATRPSRWFESRYDTQALSRVAVLADRDPAVRIYADSRFADWLLWHEPALAGRLAYDVRFELLSGAQLQAISDITALPAPGVRPFLDGYGILVLDPSDSAGTSRLLNRPGTRVILADRRVVVATRSARA
jgi:hypothetical protein